MADIIGASTLKPANQAIRNDLVRGAQSLPDLVHQAKTLDPHLAESLTEKSLVGSKTVWGPPISFGVIWLGSHYGLGWDDQTCAMLSGLISWVVLVGCRYVSRSSIGSILP